MSSDAIRKATSRPGSISALAKYLGITKSAVHQWTLEGRKVPAEHCIAIEQFADGEVTRYQLRPDVFGASPSTAQGRG